MPHRHYCTYFDHRYLPIGLALHASLQRVGGEFTLWVLALDKEAGDFLSNSGLPDIRVVPLEALEAFDPELKATEGTRSRIEYYFTCSPCLPRYLLATQGMDAITYLDSDLSFFSSPEPLFEELGEQSVLITPHRFSGTAARTHAKFGRYNVGWLTFRSDVTGMACLDWWRERCIEWCFDRVELDRYADQKYLDHFEELFREVKPTAHPGANLAPWNVASQPVTMENGIVQVAGRPLIFFHFQGLRRVDNDTYDSNLTSYGARLTPALRDGVFRPYIADLRDARTVVSRHSTAHEEQNLRRAGLSRIRLTASHLWKTLRARIAGNLIGVQ
ncbi:MAG: glycosyl transferase [Proteobacteria bacterium]|nr:glycosyl transferase [Pseudomonadota bacterium]